MVYKASPGKPGPAILEQQILNYMGTVVSDNDLDKADIDHLIDQLRQYKVVNNKATLYVGQEIYVVQRTKRTLGTIIKVNKTRCRVSMNNATYMVPMSMIEAA